MKKILMISMCDEFRGIEKLELEILKNIDKDFKVDFLTPNSKTFENYIEEIKKYGGNAYNLNIKRNNIKNKIRYARKLYSFLKKNKYDIVHINSSAFFFSFHVAIIAKLLKIKKIIVHSHSIRKPNLLKRFIIYILNPLYMKMSNEHLSCSIQASKSLYNKKVKIINNGIEIEKYKFNEEYRKELKKSLKLDNKIVYGHVGNFDDRKNQSFLIDIFYEIQKRQKESFLILVGEGKLKKSVEAKAKELGIYDKTLFMGFTKDVYKLLNCMDVFIFPSKVEGLGIAAIEAQTNGLITYCSNNVPYSAKISPLFTYFDLDDPVNEIAEKICKEKNDICQRKNAYKYTIEKKYDIKNTCKELEELYRRI